MFYRWRDMAGVVRRALECQGADGFAKVWQEWHVMLRLV